MATHSKSVPTPPVWTSAFTPVVADALALGAAGQRPRNPRRLTSCGSKASFPDTPVVPPPSSLAFVPPPSSSTSAPRYSSGAVLEQLEGCNGSTSAHRGGSRSRSNKRMAYEANAELHNVQLHDQKNVGGRRPRMTPNVRNYDQEQEQQSQDDERYLIEAINEARFAANKIYSEFEAASSYTNRKLRVARKLRNVLHEDTIKAQRTWSKASALEREAEEAHIAHRRARFEADVVIASREDFLSQGEVFSARGREEWEWEVQKDAEQARKYEKAARDKAEKAWEVAEEKDERMKTADRMLKKAEKAYGDAQRMVRRLRREVACAAATVEEVVRRVDSVRAGWGGDVESLKVEMGVLESSCEDEDEEIRGHMFN
eukprot:jgi/Undpi1/5464/HiC_scaffold_2.g00743.m1